MSSTAVEDYLKNILLLEPSDPSMLVAMGKVATAVGVTPGTATTMVKMLSESGLVAYEPRSGTRLTPGGRKLALHVLRRHRLIELFLVQVLGLDWSEVHEEAEALEHVVSEKVVDRIDALLDHPSTDPHGDPIPTAQGTVDEAPVERLWNCGAGRAVCIARVLDQDREFLRYLDRNGLRPGETVVIGERDAVAGALDLKSAAGKRVVLGTSAASKILVRKASPSKRAGSIRS